MRYLVDTNILSETIRRRPDPNVLAWWVENEASACVSTITVGELRYGIELLPEGRRKEMLQLWLKNVSSLMRGQVIGFSRSVAHVWGQLRSEWRKEGVSVPSIDGQLAAVAKRHSLTIATRNVRDFAHTGVRVINPFDA